MTFNNNYAAVPDAAGFVLLDRSGSMTNIWNDVLGSVNSYVKKIASDTPNVPHTLITFDSPGNGLSFDIVRLNVRAIDWQDVNRNEIWPRGGTPLFDALGRLEQLAVSKNARRTSVMIITDGYENQSREITRERAGQIIDGFKRRDWDVNFIGADFDAFTQAGAVGVGYGKTLNVDHTALAKSMGGFVATSSASYYSGARNAADEWSAQERAIAGGRA